MLRFSLLGAVLALACSSPADVEETETTLSPVAEFSRFKSARCNVTTPFRPIPGSFVPGVPQSPFQPDPRRNPFIDPGPTPAISTVRQDVERGTIPTPSKAPLSKSIRLGNTETILGSEYSLDLDRQILNLDLQLVDAEAADAYVHSPGSWVLTYYTVETPPAPPNVASSIILGRILIGNGGATTTLEVNLVPGGVIALPTGTVKFSAVLDKGVGNFVGTPPAQVKVVAFLHRSFTCTDNARRAFRIGLYFRQVNNYSGPVPNFAKKFRVTGPYTDQMWDPANRFEINALGTNLWSMPGNVARTLFLDQGQSVDVPANAVTWSYFTPAGLAPTGQFEFSMGL